MKFARAHLIVIAYLILASGLLFYAYRLEKLAYSTNNILKVEVQEKDRQIEQLNYMLNEQAVPAVVAMIKQLQDLGETPPKVLISPNEPPFMEQQKGG